MIYESLQILKEEVDHYFDLAGVNSTITLGNLATVESGLGDNSNS